MWSSAPGKKRVQTRWRGPLKASVADYAAEIAQASTEHMCGGGRGVHAGNAHQREYEGSTNRVRRRCFSGGLREIHFAAGS